MKEVQQIQSVGDILKCRIEELPIVYLVMQLGANYNVVNIWDGIIEKKKTSFLEIKISFLRR